MQTLFDPRAWALIWKYRGTFANGLLNTVEAAVFGFVISLMIGIIFGLFGTSEFKPLKAISRIYVEFFQNTPLMLQMLFLYYILSFGGFWKDKSFIPGATQILLVGIVSIGLYHGAYMTEVFRAGILSIPKGQFEAARSQGFGYIQMMQCVILPQTLKIILPPMVNQVVNLVKNTSCLYIVGGADLIASTYNFITGEATGGAYGPAYLICGVIFFAVCFPLSTIAARWEASLKKRDSAATLTVHASEPTEEELDEMLAAANGGGQ